MKRFAVFDIDGTLIRWQLYHVIVDKLAKQQLLGEDAYTDIKLARMRWKNRETNESFYEYEKELISQYELAITKLKSSEFDNLVDSIINEYKDQTYRFTRGLLNDLKQQGYFLIAISGSHQELVQKLTQYYGFDDSVGTKYERAGDSFTGKSYIPSFNKASALESFVNKYQLTYRESYAIGDTSSDVAMLKMVDNPIAFNPDQKLFSVATKSGWNIVVERKNVIYNLKKGPTNYELTN